MTNVKVRTALSDGIAQCRSCHHITRDTDAPCKRCGAKIQFRQWRNLDSVWAFWFAGLIAYIPANLYPLMITESYSGSKRTTILESVMLLIHHKSYLVAGVVFLFSVCVPITKFIVIAWLALSLKYGWVKNDHQRHRAHQFVEYVGRWSMVDVFVVAALAALVQIGGVVSMLPGLGVNIFALSVVLTMFSAEAFDSRLFWDQNEIEKESL